MKSRAPAELGERLRSARSGARLTKNSAAASIGMARTTLVAIEKGQRSIQARGALAFARLYGVSVGNLTSPDAIHVDLSARFRRTKERRRLGPSPRRLAFSIALLLERHSWSGCWDRNCAPITLHRSALIRT